MPQRIDWQDSFGLVLILLVATMLAIAILGTDNYGTQVAVVLQAATTLVIYRAANIGRRGLIAAMSLAIVAVLTSLAGLATPGPWAELIAGVALLILFAMGPIVIARRLLQYDRVGAETLFGALCIYLILGMFFGVLFLLMGHFGSEPLFAELSEPTAMDSIYFSFTTLTTLGYGDLSPAGDTARMLAITEALLGQIYLVTVLALIVSNLGREQKPREGGIRGKRSDAEDTDSAEDDSG